MSFYGNIYLNEAKKEETGDKKEYLKKSFLDIVNNEKADMLVSEINHFKVSGEDDPLEIKKNIAEATVNGEIDKITSCKLMMEFYEAMLINLETAEDDSEDIVIKEDTLLEYSGNQEKVSNFKEMIEEMDNVLNCLYEYCDVDINVLETVLKEFGAVKDINSARKAYQKVSAAGKNANEAFKKLVQKGGFESNPLTRFKKQANSFTVKYSSISQADKKAFQSKINTYVKKLNGKIHPWAKDQVNVNKLIEVADKFNDVAPELGDKGYEFIQSWYSGLFEDYQYAMDYSAAVVHYLHLDIEKSLFNKIIQAIFKK